MRIALLSILLFSISVYAEGLDVSELLKRGLNEQIEFVTDNEIRYCPDNTCDIYIAEKSTEYFGEYVYLHILYESSYNEIYRKEFIDSAAEKGKVFDSVKAYCEQPTKTALCALDSLGQVLGIKMGFGRYDEVHFCYSFDGKATKCKKL